MKKIGNYSAILVLLLALPSLLLAQAAPAAAPSFSEVIFRMIPLFLMVFIIFHFLVIRPQEKKSKEQAELIGSLNKNEQVVTTSGIVGRVAETREDYILLEIANNVKVKFEPQHVVKRFSSEKSTEKSAGKSAVKSS